MSFLIEVPYEPTEEMIRAACVSQATMPFRTYEEWADSHSSGIVERIRNIIIADYKAMLKAYNP